MKEDELKKLEEMTNEERRELAISLVETYEEFKILRFLRFCNIMLLSVYVLNFLIGNIHSVLIYSLGLTTVIYILITSDNKYKTHKQVYKFIKSIKKETINNKSVED